jgi:hypothetical protein
MELAPSLAKDQAEEDRPSKNRTRACIAWILMCLSTGLFVAPRTGFAETDSTQINNDRVKVWSTMIGPEHPFPTKSFEKDTILLFLTRGKVRTQPTGNRATVAVFKPGDALYISKGTEETNELVSATPVQLIAVELQDSPSPHYVNSAGLPLAFPRLGAIKALENDRVVIWNYTFRFGARTRLHFHDKDAVVVYRYDGSIASITPDGKTVVNDDKANTARFNKGGRTHYEKLVKGRESIIIVELK